MSHFAIYDELTVPYTRRIAEADQARHDAAMHRAALTVCWADERRGVDRKDTYALLAMLGLTETRRP